MIRAIIVDDEHNAISNLKWEIEEFCKDVRVVESFTNPLEAISGINYLKPDCVFLDIEMPELDGFELLGSLSFRDFDLVITSAYDNYAIRAFRQNAMDYLLKPIDSDDLIQTIERIRENKRKHHLGKELRGALEDWEMETRKKLVLPMTGKTLYVYSDEILYCKSDGNYTEIYFTQGRMEVLSKRLKDMEELLGRTFVRVHNSYVVRMNAIKEFVNQEGYHLILSDNTAIPVSRSRKTELLQMLNG